MTYKLVITKIEPNPNYDQQLADRAKKISSFGYNGVSNMEIEKMRVNDESIVLQVELTEEEYKQFKKSALEIK